MQTLQVLRWERGDPDKPENLLLRTGYLITYAGHPVVWCSKLQTDIALSTTEAEYITSSQALQQVIPMIHIMEELESIVPFYNLTPQHWCKLFEDNTSYISVAKSTRLTLRTQHIAIKYHHFRDMSRVAL